MAVRVPFAGPWRALTLASLQAEFTAMRDQYMRAGEGFIICYSITDRRSFHEVREFKQLIYRVRRTADTPVVLVGNKSDLRQLRQVRRRQRRRQRRCAGLCGAFRSLSVGSSAFTSRPGLAS